MCLLLSSILGTWELKFSVIQHGILVRKIKQYKIDHPGSGITEVLLVQILGVSCLWLDLSITFYLHTKSRLNQRDFEKSVTWNQDGNSIWDTACLQNFHQAEWLRPPWNSQSTRTMHYHREWHLMTFFLVSDHDWQILDIQLIIWKRLVTQNS